MSDDGFIKDIEQPKTSRNNDYTLLEEFKKWEFINTLPFAEFGGFCGNIDSKINDRNFFFYRVSAPLLLARLVAAGALVETHGQDGYKTTWTVALRHKETKNILYFHDYKGGASIGSNFSGYGPSLPGQKEFLLDSKALVETVCNPRFPHPYDGCVVGEIA